MNRVDRIYHGIQQLVSWPGYGKVIGPRMNEWEPIPDGALAIKDGRIASIGTAKAVLATCEADEIIDLNAGLVTPGFVDCHTHPVWAASRSDEFELRLAGASYEEILAAGGGIHNSSAKLHAATDQELLSHTKAHIAQLHRHGVVAAEAKSGYGLSLEEEVRSLKMIKQADGHLGVKLTPTCLAAHVVPKAFKDRKAEYLDLVCDQILPQVAEQKLADAADIFVEQGAFDGGDAGRLIACARKLGLRVHVHADQLSEGQGAKLAAELGATSADHLEYTSDSTRKLMAERETFAVMLPGSTFVLKQDRYAVARAFIDAGVPVALATDYNPGSSPIPNPAFIMSLACLHMGMSPKEALVAFTRNAAACLNLDEDYGSLSFEQRAAFIVWDLEKVSEIPYYAGSNMIREVIIEPTP